MTRMPVAQAIELAEVYNSEACRAQRELAGRFFGLAVLPLQEPDAALRMLETAIVDQGLAGVCLPANVNELSVVSRELIPIYARLAELQRPLVIHPTNRTMLASRHGGLPPEFERIGWMFDTSAAALALIYGGALDAAPGLIVLHPHLGGTVPFPAARMHAVEARRGGDDDKPERSIFDYFKESFYADTVSGTPGSIEMAMCLYGPGKVAFGSDYSWLLRQAALDGIQEQLGDERAASVTRTVLANLL